MLILARKLYGRPTTFLIDGRKMLVLYQKIRFRRVKNYHLYRVLLSNTLKMKGNKYNYWLISGLILMASGYGCKKDAGEGGTSSITGKVVVHDFDASFQAIQDVYPAVDERVYIIYGADHATYDDDFRTSYDGSFSFKHLQKGKYKIFAYSKDSTGAYNGTVNSALPDIPKFVEVEITKNGQDVVAPDIVILDNNQ